MRGLPAFVLAAILVALPLSAQMHTQPYQGSSGFERLKALVGIWEGEMPEKKHGKMQEMKMRVSYQLTAGGSVLMETVNAGTPTEMISMYHDRGGKLSMTHYCMLGNQPRLDLESVQEGELMFSFAEDNDIDAGKEMHMHSLALTTGTPSCSGGPCFRTERHRPRTYA